MTTLPPAPVKRRLAALMYELLLVGSVTAAAAIAAGIATIRLNPVSHRLASLTVCLLMLACWWYYFKINWHKKGRTLPMQVWKIGLCNRQGARPPLHQLRLRFIWACVFIVFVPLLAYSGLRYWGQIPPKGAFGAALIWLILPWGFAFFNPDRQFLYDFLAGTRLVDLKAAEEEKKKAERV